MLVNDLTDDKGKAVWLIDDDRTAFTMTHECDLDGHRFYGAAKCGKLHFQHCFLFFWSGRKI